MWYWQKTSHTRIFFLRLQSWMLPYESSLPQLIACCIFSQKKKKIGKALLPTFLTTIALGPLLPTQGFAGVSLIIIKQRTVLFRKGSLPSTGNQSEWFPQPSCLYIRGFDHGWQRKSQTQEQRKGDENFPDIRKRNPSSCWRHSVLPERVKKKKSVVSS